MNAYDYINKSENLRNAIHKAYGKKCFYCGEKINMYQLEIDHIIPSSDKDMPDIAELQVYLRELKNKNFIKDCIANYLPSCSHCNKQKSSQYFTVGNLRYFHEQASRHADKVIKYMEHFKYAVASPEKESEIRKLSEDKEYLLDKTIIENAYDCAYAYGLGEVRVNAFLPVSIDEELSCLLLFKQNGLSDCMFSFNEDNIKSTFFEGYKTGVTANRNFIWYINDSVIAIKFLHNRFISNFKTAEQLSIIFDDLYEEYYKRKATLLNTIGATYFEEIDKGEFAILRVPKNIWIAMVDFAQKHDHFDGNTNWDIFQTSDLFKINHIFIYKNHLDKIDADVLAQLWVKDMSGNYIDIIWQTGYTLSLRVMEGFDNIRKWKVDYTHDWILKEFIPYIFYLNLPDRSIFQRIFKQKITFEDFKNSFSHKEFGIESLSLS